MAIVRAAVLSALLTGMSVSHATASDIPAFARRYRVSCQLCHHPIPALTPFGEQFAANGFRFASTEPPRDTIDTGDPLLSLVKDLPLAVRLELYAQAYANGRASTDFQTPYALKVLSGGPISQKVSYYFYTFLYERGEVGGVEDAFIQVNDIGGKPIDIIAGQFQLSDPLFKRELRLEFEDYAVYRARIGSVPLNLTYDRGIMATADVAGFGLSAIAFNGNGRGAAEANRHFDNDGFKNYLLHVSRDVTPNVRLAALGLTGQAKADGIRNRTTMFGFDATITKGPFELNGQFLHRTDDVPTFTPSESRSSSDGGFAELLVRPLGSRWYGFGLYNLVTSDRPILDVRLGTAPDLTRYESYSAGIGRLERRNLRWTMEGTWDPRQETFRWTLGLVTAF